MRRVVPETSPDALLHTLRKLTDFRDGVERAASVLPDRVLLQAELVERVQATDPRAPKADRWRAIARAAFQAALGVHRSTSQLSGDWLNSNKWSRLRQTAVRLFRTQQELEEEFRPFRNAVDFHDLEVRPGEVLGRRRRPQGVAQTLGLGASEEQLQALYTVLVEQYVWRHHPREDLSAYLAGAEPRPDPAAGLLGAAQLHEATDDFEAMRLLHAEARKALLAELEIHDEDFAQTLRRVGMSHPEYLECIDRARRAFAPD